jgi:hypothetical protein
MRALPTILCRACRGDGTTDRSLSTHGGLGGVAAFASGPCAACQGARWEPDPRALERFAQALADVYACVLAEAPWPRPEAPNTWWDLNDAARSLAQAARLAVPSAESPASTPRALERVHGAVAAMEALLFEAPSMGSTPRARMFAAAWYLLIEAVSRLPRTAPAPIEAVPVARTEGRA